MSEHADVKWFAESGVLNRSSVLLIGNTGAEPGTSGTSYFGFGAATCGLRRRYRSSSTYCMAGLLLLHPNQLPQSSRVRPNCDCPDTAPITPVSGLMRKSRRPMSTTCPVLTDLTFPPLSPFAP